VKTALSFTENEDFAPMRVDLVHKDTGDVLSIEQDGSTRIRKATDPECSSDVIVDSLRDRVKQWMSLFLTVYQMKHVTPYMHLLVSHIPQFLEMHGTLAPFSQQGLEKLNNDLTKDYFRSTNHRDSDALKQMLLKPNRIEDLTDRECTRSKNLYTCRICKHTGHNARTCELRPWAGLQ